LIAVNENNKYASSTLENSVCMLHLQRSLSNGAHDLGVAVGERRLARLGRSPRVFRISPAISLTLISSLGSLYQLANIP
jgi:hypothetical protein